jgi:hypothetical protein
LATRDEKPSCAAPAMGIDFKRANFRLTDPYPDGYESINSHRVIDCAARTA